MTTEGILAIESLEKLEQMYSESGSNGSSTSDEIGRTERAAPTYAIADSEYPVGVIDAAHAMRNTVTAYMANSPIETRKFATHVCKHAGSLTVLGFMNGITSRLGNKNLWEKFREASKDELVPVDLGVGTHQVVFYQSRWYMADDFEPGVFKMADDNVKPRLLKKGEYDVVIGPLNTKTKIVDIESDNPPDIEEGTKQNLVDLYGGAISSEEFGKEVGTSRQAVDKQANSGNLLRFKKGARNWNYPSWQSHNGAILEGLRETIKALGDRSHWSKLLFFVSKNQYLEGVLTEEMGTPEITPIDALRQGHVQQVLAAIESDR